MFKEDSYQQIFTNKINANNLQVIKKFFVMNPPQQNQAIKPYTSLTVKKNNHNDHPFHHNTHKKGTNKFTAGFQGSLKFSEEQSAESHMVVKSKKAPPNELSTFLFGLTNKINKEAEERMISNNPKEEQSMSQSSPDKKVNYDEVVCKLSKLRKQSKKRINMQYFSQDRRNTSEFPKLERKGSDYNGKKRILVTPSLRKNQISTQSETKETGIENRLKRTEANGNKFSIKLFKGQDQQLFKKGFLAYEQEVKNFLQQNIHKIEEKAKVKKKIPGITAQSYVVVDKYSLTVFLEKNSEESIEIASLTKIMTAYLCLLACKKYSINMDSHIVRVSDKAAQMPGTSAELQAGDLITIKNLLYGLMLPSGNDASVAIAEGVGKIIQKHKYKQSKKTNYEIFINHMNYLAKEIGIQQDYQNSSGLSFSPNFSTPKAISVLTAMAMKNPIFVEIVNCKEYQLDIKNQRFGLCRRQMWKNTNKLLWKEGWMGVKTGTTQTAGHCLMSCRDNFLISVYSCESLGKRFSECAKLYEAIRNQI